MGSVGWREKCRKCEGDASVEMTLAGEALSACSFCGLLERWVEPDGAVTASGGKGCSIVSLRDSKTVSPGMSTVALAEAWRRMGSAGRAPSLLVKGNVVVVTNLDFGGRWAVLVRKMGRLVGEWVGHKRHAQVIAQVMVEGRWSATPSERLLQKRLAHRSLGARFLADLGRRRPNMGASPNGADALVEDQWDDLPL